MQIIAKRIGSAHPHIALCVFLAMSCLVYAGVIWKIISIGQ